MLRSIRWTLQLWHAAILLLALVSFGTAMYVGVTRADYARLDAELLSAAYGTATRAVPLYIHRGGGGGGGGAGGRMRPPNDGNGGPDDGPPGHRDSGQRGGGRLPRQPSEPPPDDDPPGGGGPERRPGNFERWRNGRGDGDSNRPPNGFDHPRGEEDDRFLPPPDDKPRTGGAKSPAARPATMPSEPVAEALAGFFQDQPYAVIWYNDGTTWRMPSDLADVPPPASPPDVPPLNKPPPSPEFRQRAGLREVIIAGPFGSRVLVGRSVRRQQEAARTLLWMLAGAGVAVLAVGLAGGWLLSRRITRPIEAISETARSISASDLSQRIVIDDTHSELGSLATTLNDAFGRLEGAFQQQVRFTADASHELRTPLAVIHSNAELALKRERAPAEYRKTLEVCLRAARRMRSLVDSLLVLARADAGKLELNCERFDLAETAEECVAMVATQAEERGVNVEAALAHVDLSADRTRVAQLIINLLANAIRYNREGGHVRLGLARENGDALLTVADTGVGIAEADQRHVFERFFRADKARSREAGGSGLGLAICQSIVEAHGGSITFTSQPGEGTTFRVRLPITSNGHVNGAGADAPAAAVAGRSEDGITTEARSH